MKAQWLVVMLCTPVRVLLAPTLVDAYAPQGPGKGSTYLFDSGNPEKRMYQFKTVDEEKSTLRCVQAVKKIYLRDGRLHANMGDDSRQCLNCDPAKPDCPSGCKVSCLVPLRDDAQACAVSWSW